jgi:DNA polymerase I-like protein with 3'-5' exonuclease and polymerase domains
VWLRGLIKPSEGYGLAYIDWCQQEFGIAAALSGDPKMQDAYQSGDPYLAFAKQAGAVPQCATKATHKAEREQFKACVLAVQYGMGAEALAQNINQPTFRAKELLRLHRETYKVFWRWCEGAVDHAMLHGKLWTTFGWTVHVDRNPNPRFLQNFPMQANGAEILRLACNQLIKAGIRVCAPIHDAVLIEAPLSELDEVVEHAQQIMSDASAVILDGFRLNTDVDVIRYPERYSDERGVEMWEAVMRLLEPLEEKSNA